MLRRSVWVVLAALLVLFAAVGAFAVQAFEGGQRPLTLTATESGSLPHLSAADAAAQAWASDAALFRVHATEGSPIEARVDPPFLYDTSPDPLVGNGRAVAWTYTYAAQSQPGKLFFASVGGDGAVLYQRALVDPTYGCCYAESVSDSPDGSSTFHRVAPSPPTYPVVSTPILDADDAFARVAARPEFAEFPADHPVFQAFLELMPGPDGHALWGITYRTATYFAAYALVDAHNGTVHHVSAWPTTQPPCCDPVPPTPTPVPPDPCCRPDDHHAEYGLTLGPTRNVQYVNFPVEEPRYAREARIVVQLTSVLPLADEAVLQVYDTDMRPLARASGRDTLEAVLTSFPTQGVYQAVLTLPTPVREIAATVTVDVLYDAVPSPAPTSYAFSGVTYPWSGDAYLPLWFQERAQPTQLTLRWTPVLATDELELALLDPYGNEIATARAEDGATEVALDVPPDQDCCYTAVVRNLVRAPVEVPFELEVAVMPWEEPYPTHHPVHAH